MKKYMPLEGLRWSRDSGSALCDTSQNSRSRTGWGDGTKIYFEYNSGAYGLTVGHKPGATMKGKTYTIKPTMVYNKGGKLHKAVITIKMKY